MVDVEPFEEHRAYLVRLAYRLLGSVSDAEDMVQESFVRWHTAGRPALENPRAWFTRTCTRLCLDRLKSARHERRAYPGEWLPEPLVDEEQADGAGELDESLSMALLVTIEKLRPAERAAFLLHDVFGYPFAEVAEIVGLEPAHCRQLAVRARRNLRDDRSRGVPDGAAVQQLSDAFFRAVTAGDLAGLEAVLAEDVVLRSDGGGVVPAARHPIVGAASVARFFVRVFAAEAREHPFRSRSSWFNGSPGVVVYQGGRPVSAFHFDVADGRIAGIYVQRNPDKLGAFA